MAAPNHSDANGPANVPLFRLPNELLMRVVILGADADPSNIYGIWGKNFIVRVSETSRRLYAIANPILYSWVAQAEHENSPAVKWASMNNRLDILRKAIQAGQNVNAVFEKPLSLLGLDPTRDRQQTFTALHLAARRGNDEIVGYLIDNGADLDATASNWDEIDPAPGSIYGRENHYPILAAVWANQISTACLMLSRGASVSIGPPERMSPYQDLSPTILHAAAARSHVELCRKLVAEGIVDVNARCDRGFTPLHWACMKPMASAGSEDALPILVQLGADVNSSDNQEGRPPIFWVIRNDAFKDHPRVNALLDAGADPSARDPHGYTPLMELVMYRMSCVDELVGLLVARGADINSVDNAGYTALWWACGATPEDINTHQVEPVLQQLLELGADPNVGGDLSGDVDPRNLELNGALRRCIQCQHIAHCELLDKFGATPLQKEREINWAFKATVMLGDYPEFLAYMVSKYKFTGNTSKLLTEMFAKQLANSTYGLETDGQRRYDMTKWVFEMGPVDVNYRDEHSLTPLHRVCMAELHTAADVKLADELLKRGANLIARDRNGNSPLYCAVQRGNTPLVQFLMAKGAV
jgi:ankyrin repeat protein